MMTNPEINELLKFADALDPSIKKELRAKCFPKVFQVTLVVNAPEGTSRDLVKKVVERNVLLSEVLMIEEVFTGQEIDKEVKKNG